MVRPKATPGPVVWDLGPPESEGMACGQSQSGNLGDPSGRTRKSQVKIKDAYPRQDPSPLGKSDRLIVAMKWSNAHGAKGTTKAES